MGRRVSIDRPFAVTGGVKSERGPRYAERATGRCDVSSRPLLIEHVLPLFNLLVPLILERGSDICHKAIGICHVAEGVRGLCDGIILEVIVTFPPVCQPHLLKVLTEQLRLALLSGHGLCVVLHGSKAADEHSITQQRAQTAPWGAVTVRLCLTGGRWGAGGVPP